jgi:tryptophan synthase alpha chain
MDLAGYLRGRLERRPILLMTHLIVGYPSLDANRRMLAAMADADVDLVELQMPFSEPIADGPAFARACQQALAAGTCLAQYFALLAESAAQYPFAHLMMGYYNTIFRRGPDAFCQSLAAAGAAGCIVPDLPVDEYAELGAACRAQGLHPIQLMAPTSTDARLSRIGAQASGFVYVVARRGVTGRASDVNQEVFELLARCRRHTDLPLGVGFGLSSATHLERLRGHAQIGIVGSALLGAWEAGGEGQYRQLLLALGSGRG